MKVYSLRRHRHVERQIHFAVGNSVHTACGLVLLSRHIMVSVHSPNDGSVITNEWGRVTCKRCLRSRHDKFLRLIEIERACPGLFDFPRLCGEEWLLTHALNVSQKDIEAQRMTVVTPNLTLELFASMKGKELKASLDFIATEKTKGE